ncbi:MAG: lysylphosphatidylglycerol synthase transmembrane domain-containing protein [Myxococcota bacterium]
MTSSAEPSFARRVAPKLALSLVLGALFVWLGRRTGLEFIPAREDFAELRLWTVPAYVGCLLVTHLLRATRWRFLIAPVKRVPLGEVIALNWIGFFAIFALPLRLGEMARPALTKMRHQVPVSVGIGTVAVERVIDGLVTSLCVAWALFALPRVPTDDELASALPYYGYLALTVFAGAFVALGVFLAARSWAVRTTKALVGLVSKKLAALLAEKVDGVAEGLRSLTSPRLTAGFLLETLGYWGTNAFGMWLLAWGCGIPLGFGHAVALMGILAIGILLPAAPGLFGAFQLAIQAGLKLYFAASIVEGPGNVYIFLLFVIQAVFIVLVGVVPLYAMKLRLSDLLGAEALREGMRPSDPAAAAE